jgi:hypothetical protein
MFLEESVVVAGGFNFDVAGEDYVIGPGGLLSTVIAVPFGPVSTLTT